MSKDYMLSLVRNNYLVCNIVNNYVSDYSSLFETVYVAPEKTDPFLWQVYPLPSLEYVKHGLVSLQLRESNPVLFKLLTEVVLLYFA